MREKILARIFAASYESVDSEKVEKLWIKPREIGQTLVFD